YTHLLDESDGSVLDDIIIWWVDEETFDVMPNASNTDRVRNAIGGQETTHARAVIAVQGPAARERLATVYPQAAAVKRFRVERVDLAGVPAVVAGTGYTGEDGVELAVPADAADEVWQSITDAGIAPAGLGARDTLRLEAALPLHGHELGPGISPLQAGLGFVVAWLKGDFRGRSALEVEHAQGVHRLLRGIATPGRRPPREDCVVTIDGEPVGTVTSGNYSPVLGHGISLAFLPTKTEDGTEVVIDVRGASLSGTVVPTPFVSKRT
ncbi:MAG: glycine cleavage T C-terminal barrel domain-containing protein, partial [Ilumatobacteraceae bacterium]